MSPIEGGDAMIRQFRYRVVFICYFFFAEYLLFSGEITRFIAPRFAWLTYISVIMLGLFLFFAQRGSHDEGTTGGHGPAKENPHREMAKLLFLIYPLFLFIIFRPVAISDLRVGAIRPVMKKNTSASGAVPSLHIEEDGYVHVNLYGLWLILDSEPSLLKKYKFKTMGRVSKVSGKNLSIQRILITCCTADAQPVEINVATEGSGQFKKGEWLVMTGKVELRDGLTFIPDDIKRVPRPDEFYISLYESIPKMTTVP